MLKNLGFLVSPKGRSIRIDSSARTRVWLVHRGRLCSRLLSLIQIGGKKTLTKSTNKFAETMMKSARKLLLFRSLLHHLTMPNASNNFHCLLLIFMLPWFRISTICLISNSHDDGGILFIILHWCSATSASLSVLTSLISFHLLLVSITVDCCLVFDKIGFKPPAAPRCNCLDTVVSLSMCNRRLERLPPPFAG